MPLVVDVPHKQGAVQLDRAWRKPGRVSEEARPGVLHVQRLDAPSQALQVHTVVVALAVGGRIPGRAQREEPGGLVQGWEQARLRQPFGWPAREGDLLAPVPSNDPHRHRPVGLADLKRASVEYAGEDTTAERLVEPRVGIAAGDEHPLPEFAVLVPLDGIPVGRVL